MEKINFSVEEELIVPKKSFWKRLFSVNNKFFSILIGLVFAGVFCTSIYVYATYGIDEPYPIGNTLNPSCTPGASNCTVTPIATYSYTSDFTGSSSFTTTAAIHNKASNSKHYFGASDNASIYYDGSNLILDPAESGAGKVNIGGIYTLPIVTGSSGQALITNGAGVASWGSDFGSAALTTTGTGTFGIGRFTTGIKDNAGTPLLSMDPGARKLYATDGTTLMMDYSNSQGTSTAINVLLGGAGNSMLTAEGSPVLTGDDNFFVGYQAGKLSTIAYNNVFIGSDAGLQNNGHGNNFLGWSAASFNTTGSNSNVFGHQAGKYNVGDGNNFFGYQAGFGNVNVTSTGTNNNFFGYQAGHDTTTGSSNTFMGAYSGYSNSTGLNNIFMGDWSGTYNTIGSHDVFIGYDAGYTNITGSNNIAIGREAGYSNSSGSGDVFIGPYAGKYETASNAFYVDNQDRTNTAGDKAKALLYGTFATTAAGQSLTVNGNTNFSNGFTTLNYGTSAPSLTTNGQVAVAYVGSSNRLYWYSNGGAHYVNATAGFEIPGFETSDPISGEKIEVGDIVLGMVNKNMGDESTAEESSLHGVWVKWDSVKAQLLAEARGELSKTGTWGTGSVASVSTETLSDKLMNVLTSFGVSLKDGVMNVGELVTDKFTARVARVERLEMVDSNTGEVYCTWVEKGEMMKARGDCGSIKPNTNIVRTSTSVETMVQMTTQSQQASQRSQTSAQVAQKAAQESQQAAVQAEESKEKAMAAADIIENIALKVQPMALNVTSVATIPDINVGLGTSRESLPLPTVVSVVLSDESTQELGVTWDNGNPEYNQDTEGTYVFSGTLTLAEGIGNENNVTAVVNVAVASPVATATIGNLIQKSAAGLINSMAEFIKDVFGATFKRVSSLQVFKKATAGLIQNSEALKENVLSPTTESFTAGLVAPIKRLLDR